MSTRVSKQKLQARVDAGAAFLNVVHPGWAKKIKPNLNVLDLGDGKKCVLGELYGEFSDGKVELGLSSTSQIAGNGSIPQPEVLGFFSGNSRQYKTLTLLWKLKIKKILRSR